MQVSPIIADPNRTDAPQRSRATRDRIMAAARAFLRDNDLRSFTIERVALKARVSPRLVYGQFADRIELYRAVQVAMVDSFAPMLAVEMPPHADLTVALERFAANAISILGCSAHRELALSASRDAETDPWIRQFYDERVTQTMRHVLDRFLLAQALRGRIASADLIGLADQVLAMIFASVPDRNRKGLLTPAEIAIVLASRLSCPSAAGTAADERTVSCDNEDQDDHGRSWRPALKRGAITLTRNPIELRWNNQPVPLSRLEAEIAAEIVQRERVSWRSVDALLQARQASPDCRSVLIYRIRRKFAALGAGDPFQTVRSWGIRLRPEI